MFCEITGGQHSSFGMMSHWAGTQALSHKSLMLGLLWGWALTHIATGNMRTKLSPEIKPVTWSCDATMEYILSDKLRLCSDLYPDSPLGMAPANIVCMSCPNCFPICKCSVTPGGVWVCCKILGDLLVYYQAQSWLFNYFYAFGIRIAMQINVPILQ